MTIARMSRAAVWVLIAAAISPVWAVRAQSNGAAVQAAVAVLGNPAKGPEMRISAARELAVLGRDSDSATGALMAALANDLNPGVRSAAAAAIGYAAFPSAAPIQALIQALNTDTSLEVRLSAARALGIIGVDSASALQALQSAAANDPAPQVRELAQMVAGRLGPN